MNKAQRPALIHDPINLIFIIGVSVFVAYQPMTGGWTFSNIVICAFVAIAVHYWVFFYPIRTCGADKDIGKDANPTTNPPTSASPGTS